MDESNRHPKFLYNKIDTVTIVRKISEAREHVQYIAPGVTGEIAKALQDAFLRVPGSVKIIVDVSRYAFEKGFNNIESMRDLRQFAKNFSFSPRLDFRIETGIRMGVLEVDDETLVFVPPEVTLEDINTPLEEAEISVTGIQYPYESQPNMRSLGEKLLVDAVFPGDEKPNDALAGDPDEPPDIPENPTTKPGQIKVFGKGILPIIDTPKGPELLPIQLNLMYAELSTSGVRIANCKISMPADLLAEVAPEIKERVEAKYKVFNEEDGAELYDEKMKITNPLDGSILFFSLNDFLEKIENLRKMTKKIDVRGKKETVIRTCEKELFQEKVDCLKYIASEMTYAMSDYIEKKIHDRIKEIVDILCSDGTLGLFEVSNKKEYFKRALEESARQTVQKFKIDVDFTTKGISTEDAKSEDFRKAVEKAFGKDVASELYGA